MHRLWVIVLWSGCGGPRPAATARHGEPSVIRFGHTDVGHCGPYAGLQLVVTRGCELAITVLGTPPRREVLEPATCRAVFELAARVAPAPCPVAAQFIAGIEVQLADGTLTYGCADSPLGAAMGRVGERYAPQWRTTSVARGSCLFDDDSIDGTLIDGTLNDGARGR